MNQADNQNVTDVPQKRASLWAKFIQPNFVVATAVLLVAAVGLNASVGYLQLHFKKEPVPMAMKFADAMPEVIGTWVRVAKDDTIDPDTLAALATEEFLFCNYVNAKEWGGVEAVRKEFAAMKGYDEQRQAVARMQREKPTAVMSLGLTYYTGKADTVAHIPERCYVGNGYEPENPANESWNLGEKTIPVRHVSFEDQTGRGALKCNVAYFFHCNGEFDSDSLGVRAKLQDLRAKHGYYAKVELMTVTPKVEESKAAMKAFLAAALPHMNAAMPDWSQYAGR